MYIAPKFHIFMEYRVELTYIALHNLFGLSCFFHKLEKLQDKIRAKTVENIGPDVKVLVLDVAVLVPGCGNTGRRMCQIVSRNAAGKVC